MTNPRSQVEDNVAVQFGVFIVGVAGIFFESWAIWKLWIWHLMPLGLPQIRFGTVVVVGLIFCMLTSQAAPYPAASLEQRFERILAHSFLLPVLALLFGWVLR